MSKKNNIVKKELTDKESLFMILDVLEELNIRYWVDGGWGVDILIGEQTREHRDVDIDFDATSETILIDKLEKLGYQITTDWRPARVELSHPIHGYIDIHPLIISDSGDAKQADLEGGWYHFKAEYFSEALFEGRTIPCISLEAQRIFHSGYELREVDKEDLKKLEEIDKSKPVQEKIRINNIPAILYGSASDKLYLYVHGKYSRKEEAEHFASIAGRSGYQVLSFDLPEHGERTSEPYPCTVQNSVHDLKEVYSFIKNKYNNVSLYACSIGAYFSLLAYRDIKFEKCLFLSPILDMKRLIQNMMKWSNISKEELKEKEEHETSFGETLSWDYYEYVRNNPVGKWDSPTFILYGENDNLTERCVLDSFTTKYNCIVDVMPNGEHYFHTKKQLDYLENWLEKVIG